MSTLAIEIQAPEVQDVAITDDTLTLELVDGRSISVPLAWYPRLLYGTAVERSRWRLVGAGEGIHWPVLDEDISVLNVLLGQPSGESHQSFRRWLVERGLEDEPSLPANRP